MKPQKIQLMCLTALLTAAAFILTAYVHLPSHTGYIHPGDALIYLAACLLPLSHALFVGVGGAVLADCLTGFAVWAPASMVVKAVSVLCFSSKANRILTMRNRTALLPASLVSIGGYYLYEMAITANAIAPLAGIPGYIIQALLSIALFVTLGVVLDKLNFKERF